MLKNYLKITLRNLAKHKLFTAINLIGLALGMSVCLLNILIIKDQRSADRFHENQNRIYRIITDLKTSDYASSPALLTPVLLHEYTGVEAAVRLSNFDGSAEHKGSALPVTGLYAEPSYFRMFSFDLLTGDKDKALVQPFSIVISQETANKFFGNENPLGKVLTFPHLADFIITGVLKDISQRTHLDADVLVSFSTISALQKRGLQIGNPEDWKDRWNFYNYVLLENGKSPAQVEAALSQIAERVYNENNPTAFHLQALTDIALGEHLHNQIGNVMEGLDLYVGLFFAVIILVAACFNYVGLTIARSLKRAKEIGIRKVIGAQRTQIAGQFLGETIIIALLSLVLACVLLDWLLPAFNSLQMVQNALNASISIDLTENLTVYLFFIAFSIFTGLLAGIFPALHMSAMLPVKVLKGLSQIRGFSGLTLRKVLLITQFSLSLLFIISAIVVYRQYMHMRHADYGFNKENVISVELRGGSYERFKNALLGNANIVNVSASSAVMGERDAAAVSIQSSHVAEPIEAAYFAVDPGYIDHFDLALVAGRNFSTAFSVDSVESVIVNETAVQRLGLKNNQDAIGQTITVEQNAGRIIGVVKDFHYSWLKKEIGPMILRYDPGRLQYAFIHLAPVDHAGAITAIEKTWKQVNDIHPFHYRLLDARLSEAYADFNDIARFVGFIASMAIFISCLGLLGMAIHSAESRIKEIGIRKVLGASAAGIALLLSKDFAKLLAIAVVIATPLAWILDSMWLSNFAYRIDFGPATLLLSIALMAILALITIGSQTLKAALANPVEALRYE